MKDSQIRHSYEFVVTKTVACSHCNELKPEKDVGDKSRYIYGSGWIKRFAICDECFNKLADIERARVKGSDESFYGEGF